METTTLLETIGGGHVGNTCSTYIIFQIWRLDNWPYYGETGPTEYLYCGKNANYPQDLDEWLSSSDDSLINGMTVEPVFSEIFVFIGEVLPLYET